MFIQLWLRLETFFTRTPYASETQEDPCIPSISLFHTKGRRTTAFLSYLSRNDCKDNNHINPPRVVSALALIYDDVAPFIIAFAPVGRPCVLLNHLHPLGVCRLFTFTHVAKIIRGIFLFPRSHTRLFTILLVPLARTRRVFRLTRSQKPRIPQHEYFSRTGDCIMSIALHNFLTCNINTA